MGAVKKLLFLENPICKFANPRQKQVYRLLLPGIYDALISDAGLFYSPIVKLCSGGACPCHPANMRVSTKRLLIGVILLFLVVYVPSRKFFNISGDRVAVVLLLKGGPTAFGHERMVFYFKFTEQ